MTQLSSEKPELLIGSVCLLPKNGARTILADIAHGQKSAKKFLEHYDEQLYA
jgi:hypothetical protein